MRRPGMKTPEAKIFHENLLAKSAESKRSHMKMIRDVLNLHQPGGYGCCGACWEVGRGETFIRSSYPCRTVRLIERKLS